MNGWLEKEVTLAKITTAVVHEYIFPKMDRNKLFLKSPCLYLVQNLSTVVGSVDSGG